MCDRWIKDYNFTSDVAVDLVLVIPSAVTIRRSVFLIQFSVMCKCLRIINETSKFSQFFLSTCIYSIYVCQQTCTNNVEDCVTVHTSYNSARYLSFQHLRSKPFSRSPWRRRRPFKWTGEQEATAEAGSKDSGSTTAVSMATGWRPFADRTTVRSSRTTSSADRGTRST